MNQEGGHYSPVMRTQAINYWKTSDIRISKDSQGMYEASHKYQGYLLDWSYFDSRTECRREAVQQLKDRKEAEESGEGWEKW